MLVSAASWVSMKMSLFLWMFSRMPYKSSKRMSSDYHNSSFNDLRRRSCLFIPVHTMKPQCSPCTCNSWRMQRSHRERRQTFPAAGFHNSGSQLWDVFKIKRLSFNCTGKIKWIIQTKTQNNSPKSSLVSNLEVIATWSFPLPTIWMLEQFKMVKNTHS